jgi:peptidoglycan/LPS O-acetylase OafA/YrhL
LQYAGVGLRYTRDGKDGSTHYTRGGDAAKERNRLIDGWRGVSVTLVIIGHLIGFRFAAYFHTTPFRVLLGDEPINAAELAKNVVLRLIAPLFATNPHFGAMLPQLGVSIFFIISGYLITSLLINEERSRNAISFKAFYVRRTCRIIPAFFTYLATLLVLAAMGVLAIPRDAFIWSSLFLCDTAGEHCTWFLGHTWSLAVEEQFYLAWPLMFMLLGREWRTKGLAVILVAMLSLSFVYDLPISFAYIAIGSLCASSATVRNKIIKMATTKSIAIATAIIFIQPFLQSMPLVFSIINAARPTLLAMIFLGTINGRGPYVRMVSLEWIRHIGLASYSVYLWQQLSTGGPGLYPENSIMLIPALFILPALVSYFVIEKPIIRLGHRLSDAITR